MGISAPVERNKCVVCHGRIGLGRLRGNQLCRACWDATGQTVLRFQELAPAVLRNEGPSGPGWAVLVRALNNDKIPPT
jgi:hypothetical protein